MHEPKSRPPLPVRRRRVGLLTDLFARAASVRGLSARQREVGLRVFLGQTNPQICRSLGLALGTVKSHRARVMRRFRAQGPIAFVHAVHRAARGAPPGAP